MKQFLVLLKELLHQSLVKSFKKKFYFFFFIIFILFIGGDMEKEKELASFNHSVSIIERKNILITGVKKVARLMAARAGTILKSLVHGDNRLNKVTR